MTHPETGRRRGRPRAGEELPEDVVLAAALAAFAEGGFEGMTVRELGRRLQVSHSLIGTRFGTKQDLWFAAIDWAFQRMHTAMREQIAASPHPHDGLDRLRQGIAAHVTFSAQEPSVLRIMTQEGAIDGPRIRYIYDHFIHPVRKSTEALLDRLITEGRIRPIPYAAFHLLVAHGGGAIFASPAEAALLGSPNPTTPDRITAHANLIADIIVDGLITR